MSKSKGERIADMKRKGYVVFDDEKLKEAKITRAANKKNAVDRKQKGKT